jgi:fucose 4-O-acetylase-like acetyltransferase
LDFIPFRHGAGDQHKEIDVLTGNLSKRIISLRFLLIVFVIIIHNGISEKSFEGRGINAIIPSYVLSVQSLVGIITAIAVPLYFFISGYLLYLKETKLIPVLKKRSRTILVPYFIWSILFIVFYLAVSLLPFTKHFFAPDHSPALWNGVKWLYAFIGDYSEGGGGIRGPFVFQFWFLRDLFILNVFFIIIKKLIDKFPLGMLILISILWVNNVPLWLVSPAALFFFTLGYYAVKYNLNETNIDKIKASDLFGIYVVAIILQFLFKEIMPTMGNVTVVVGCIVFLKISKYFVKNIKLYTFLAWLEKYQFVVYAVHAVIMPQVFKIYIRIVPMNGVFILLGYFCMIIFGVFVSLMFGVVLKKLFPGINAMLTGGRV